MSWQHSLLGGIQAKKLRHLCFTLINFISFEGMLFDGDRCSVWNCAFVLSAHKDSHLNSEIGRLGHTSKVSLRLNKDSSTESHLAAHVNTLLLQSD